MYLDNAVDINFINNISIDNNGSASNNVLKMFRQYLCKRESTSYASKK